MVVWHYKKVKNQPFCTFVPYIHFPDTRQYRLSSRDITYYVLLLQNFKKVSVILIYAVWSVMGMAKDVEHEKTAVGHRDSPFMQFTEHFLLYFIRQDPVTLVGV